jgi:hypothetical protein
MSHAKNKVYTKEDGGEFILPGEKCSFSEEDNKAYDEIGRLAAKRYYRQIGCRAVDGEKYGVDLKVLNGDSELMCYSEAQVRPKWTHGKFNTYKPDVQVTCNKGRHEFGGKLTQLVVVRDDGNAVMIADLREVITFPYIEVHNRRKKRGEKMHIVPLCVFQHVDLA